MSNETKEIEHADGDGCAIYPPGYTVTVDGAEMNVEDLSIGDVFDEYGSAWQVFGVYVMPDGDPETAGDVHVDLEAADGCDDCGETCPDDCQAAA